MEKEKLITKLQYIGEIENFERHGVLNELIDIVKATDKETLIKAINTAMFNVKKDCIENGVCPECGKELVDITTDYERDTNSYIGYSKCPNCGFEN